MLSFGGSSSRSSTTNIDNKVGTTGENNIVAGSGATLNAAPDNIVNLGKETFNSSINLLGDVISKSQSSITNVVDKFSDTTQNTFKTILASKKDENNKTLFYMGIVAIVAFVFVKIWGKK